MNKKLICAAIGILIVSLCMPVFHFPVASASQDEWIDKAAMPTPRSGIGVAVVNGKIYVIGGLNGNTQLAVVEEYDPFRNTWTTRTPMPTARSGFAVAVYQNKIYCIGGTVGDGYSLVLGFTGVNEVYDPVKNIWETKASMPTSRADLQASVVDNKIYVVGGKERLGAGTFREIDVTEVYDPETNSWTTKASMPVPAFGYMSEVIDDKIYVIGGARQFQEGLENLVSIHINQVYDVKNDTWSTKASLPASVSHGAAAVTSGVITPRKVYIVGGYDQINYSNVTYVYDAENNVWSYGAFMPTARAYLGLAVVDDVLYAIGGFDGLNLQAVNQQYIPPGYGTVPPEVRIISPENTTYATKNIQLVISVNRETTWMGYSLNDRENVTIMGDTELPRLAEGEHKLLVYVNDTFGNTVSSDTLYFSVDTIPPQIKILSPENRIYGERDIPLIFEVNEPVSWMGYSLNGQDNVTVTGNVTLAALPDGSHYITLYATDLVGNVGTSKTVYFEISPFPTVIVVASAVIVIIAISTVYLLLKRRKQSNFEG